MALRPDTAERPVTATRAAAAAAAAVAAASVTAARPDTVSLPVTPPRPDTGQRPVVTRRPEVAPGTRPAKSRKADSGPATATTGATTKVARPKARRGKAGRRIMLVAGGVGCAAAAGIVAVHAMSGGGPHHAISTPQRLGSYVEEPSLASGMGANALRSRILAAGGGEASHVVDAVYEDSSGAAAKSGPLIVLFVGGNLSGSASSFINSLATALPGAFVINPGSLQGQAACVPGPHLAECAWADNDTFGVIASPVLSATALGAELRIMRPMVEHEVK
jgi:hypothetical protein